MMRWAGLLMICILTGCSISRSPIPPVLAHDPSPSSHRPHVARHAKPHLHDGTLTLVLDGKSYSGGWRYSAPPQGKGTIDLFSADGRAIHCTFKSSTAAANAIGWCDDESGNLYDLHIDKLNSGH